MESAHNLDAAKNKLENALQSVKQSPCEKYKCKYSEECKNKQLACIEFKHYVNSGVARQASSAPTRKQYLQVFGQE